MRHGAVLAVLLLAGACQSGPAARGDAGVPGGRIAVLPFRGLESPAELIGEVRDRLVAALATEGVEVLAGREVEAVLRDRRIRVVDTLPRAEAEDLATSLGARLVAGTVLMARAEPEPEFALLLRFYGADGARSGSLLWSRKASEDVDLFGLGAPEGLPELLERELPELASTARRDADRVADGTRPTVAILPFESAPGQPDSGTQGSILLAHLLEEEYGLQVVEPGDLQRFFRRARIHSLALMDLRDFRKLAAETGTRWFLRGRLLESVPGRGPGDPPRVTIVLQVFDAQQLRTVASCCVHRSGDEGEVVFGLGQTFHPVRNLARALAAGLDQLGAPWASS